MSMVSWFHRFRGFTGLVVLMVSWFHSFRVRGFQGFGGVNGFIASWLHGFMGFVVSIVS